VVWPLPRVAVMVSVAVETEPVGDCCPPGWVIGPTTFVVVVQE